MCESCSGDQWSIDFFELKTLIEEQGILEARKVFIDTQSFVKAGLNFGSYALNSFRRLCESEEFFHISTTVVDREVKDKIQGPVNNSV